MIFFSFRVLLIPPCSALVSRDSYFVVLIPHPMLSCFSSASRPIVRPRSCRLVGVAGAFLGMAIIDSLLLLQGGKE
jgi:hypothetical protein